MDYKGDIHTNGTPKCGQDNLLKKDNMATAEARSFDIKVGDPMDKTDGKKEDSNVISGLSVGQIGSHCQGSMGENGFGQISNTDMFGFSQQGMNRSANMNVGMAPFQPIKPPSMAESQKTSILHANEPPKPFLAPSKPSDTSTHNIVDKPAVSSWTGQAMLTHSPIKAEQSPFELLGYQGVPHKDATSDGGSDENVQQKRRECETSEEAYGLLECLRSPEKTQSKSSDQEDCSVPDNGENWRSEIREWGGGRIQAKKSKSRKKLPEEWANLPSTGCPSPPPDPLTPKDMDMDTIISDMYEVNDSPTIIKQKGSLHSCTTTLQSAIPVTISQEITTSSPNNLDQSKSNQNLTPNLTSGLDTTVHAIYSPHTATSSFQNNSSVHGSSSSDHSSIVVNQNSEDPASLTTQTMHLEPPVAKSHQEDTTAKEKIEKIDTSPKTDVLNTLVKANTNEKTEKTDNKKMDNMGKIQETEKQDSKSEKNGNLEKMSNLQETKKDMKDEKKNGVEKVDKMIKNEKNVKAAKETSKGPAANGTKDLISPDNVKTNKQNSIKPSSHSTGENSSALTSSSGKKGPVAKKTSPTGAKKPPGITSTHEAKTSGNSTPAQRKPPVPKFNESSKGSSGTKTSNSSVKTLLKKTSTNAASAPATPATDPAPRPSRITKPPVPKQVPLPKKRPVPPTPRNSRIPNTPRPDLKNVSSKIGSTDNMKYQPGGGKVQITHKKMDFSHITSRCGSKDNIKHVPGGGNVQILTKKVDLSKVTSKCGSKDNINHKPGGGNVKTESQKSKTNSKMGSMDNVDKEPGGDHAEGVGDQPKESPPAPANPPIQTSGGIMEMGLKDSTTVPPPAPSEGQGLWNSQSQNKQIPATN
ncbi:uncharacterized protein map4l isoform 2-T2 [Clarias gariepinus]